MYESVRYSPKSSKMVGIATAIGLTAITGWALASSHISVDKIAKNAMEMIILAPPEPPPPVKEPEKPKIEVPKDTPAPPPELVAPDIPFVVETPVITAPVAEPTPIPEPIPVAPAPAAPSVGTDRVSPKLQAGDKPQYPAASVRAGEQGTTHLEVCVSTAGRVTSVSVAGSSGSARLDDAAAKWLRSERFKPGTVGGQAQSMCGHDVYYEWNLKDAR